MKKYLFLTGVLCAAVFFTGCKSKESAYKAAYERAQQNQQAEQQAAAVTPVVSPVGGSDVAAPTTVTPVAPTAQTITPTNPNNVPVRSESVTLVNGVGIQAYNVVCGSFSVKANAEALQKTLKGKGYSAQVVINTSITPNMYRVVATTHGDKVAAVQSRDVLRADYPDAWILYNK
ncbi:MAG: SPOR domain-containing protein [Bacteroidaceae bacterium]|nr:SPOR domain-containing protein [Bacteroidaceae bacterium]